MQKRLTYRDSGVDINQSNQSIPKIRDLAIRTYISGVLSGVGGFGALFDLGKTYRHPILVSGTDGVGTKVQLSHLTGLYRGIGQDLLGMCANDILVYGAQPLFFLDYFASGIFQESILLEVIAGLSDACIACGCSLVGGETAEMPGVYAGKDYDIAGFIVGVVEKDSLIDGTRLEAGNILIGLGSDGFHSNGYSLVRAILQASGEASAEALSSFHPVLGSSLGKLLMQPTRLYIQSIHALLKKGYDLRAMAHITGGGLPENTERMFPQHLRAALDYTAWTLPPLFSYFAEKGNLEKEEMYRTFNSGIGFVIALPEVQAEAACILLSELGEHPYIIGEVVLK